MLGGGRCPPAHGLNTLPTPAVMEVAQSHLDVWTIETMRRADRLQSYVVPCPRQPATEAIFRKPTEAMLEASASAKAPQMLTQSRDEMKNRLRLQARSAVIRFHVASVKRTSRRLAAA